MTYPSFFFSPFNANLLRENLLLLLFTPYRLTPLEEGGYGSRPSIARLEDVVGLAENILQDGPFSGETAGFG